MRKGPDYDILRYLTYYVIYFIFRYFFCLYIFDKYSVRFGSFVNCCISLNENKQTKKWHQQSISPSADLLSKISALASDNPISVDHYLRKVLSKKKERKGIHDFQMISFPKTQNDKFNEGWSQISLDVGPLIKFLWCGASVVNLVPTEDVWNKCPKLQAAKI